MKKLLLGVSLFAAVGAFAGCEDGNSTSEDSALNALYKKVPSLKNKCTATSEDPTDASNGDEDYAVVISCKDHLRSTFTYSVTLHEIEDAMCVVKSVKQTGANG